MSSPTPEGRRQSDLNVSMPPTNKGLLAAAGVCLLIPVVALMWVASYNQETPRLGGIPFFFWYQFVWVFITSAFTYTAHRLVLAARGEGGRDADEVATPPNEPAGGGDTPDRAPGVRS